MCSALGLAREAPRAHPHHAHPPRRPARRALARPDGRGAPPVARRARGPANRPAILSAWRKPPRKTPPHVPGPDPRPAALLGGPGLRAAAALRHGSGRGHFPHRDLPARGRSRALECRVCAAEPEAYGRPIRRQPVPAPALLPVPGGDEALAGRFHRTLLRLARRARHRRARARPAPRRGQLGIADARRLGPRLGGVAERHGSHAVHVLPAGRAGSTAGRSWARSPTASSASRCTCRASRASTTSSGPTGRRAGSPTATCTTRTRWSSPGYNFEHADTASLFAEFDQREKNCKALVEAAAAAAGLRADPEGLARLQPARRAQGDQRHRAAALHPARADASRAASPAPTSRAGRRRASHAADGLPLRSRHRAHDQARNEPPRLPGRDRRGGNAAEEPRRPRRSLPRRHRRGPRGGGPVARRDGGVRTRRGASRSRVQQAPRPATGAAHRAARPAGVRGLRRRRASRRAPRPPSPPPAASQSRR